jgi:hypothetical protein
MLELLMGMTGSTDEHVTEEVQKERGLVYPQLAR